MGRDDDGRDLLPLQIKHQQQQPCPLLQPRKQQRTAAQRPLPYALIFYPQFFTRIRLSVFTSRSRRHRRHQLPQKVNNIYEVLKLVEGSAY